MRRSGIIWVVFAFLTCVEGECLAQGVIFKDVTRSAGIRFRHDNGGSGREYMPETMGSGCAFWDYDGDGDADILLVNSAPLNGRQPETPSTMVLYRNEGRRDLFGCDGPGGAQARDVRDGLRGRRLR